MAEWAPEAERHLADYLARVEALARRQGDNAEEIVGELRAHIVMEAEGESGAVVSIEHIRRVLGAMGTPEEVMNVEEAPPGGLPEPKKLPGRPGRGMRTFIWAVAVVLPVLAGLAEANFGAVASYYLNPIPTWIHFVGLGCVPVIIGFTDIWMAKRGGAGDRKVLRRLLVANSYALFLSGLYALVFLPLLPISFALVAVFGLGLGGFAPLLCLIASVYQLRRLSAWHGASGGRSSELARGMLAGVALILVFFAIAECPRAGRRHALHLATSLDLAQQEEGLWWLAALGGEEEVLRGCYEGVWPRWVGALGGEEIASPRQCRRIYYRMTGESFSSVKRPRGGSDPLFGGSIWQEWVEETTIRKELGEQRVGGVLDDVFLESSVQDLNIEGMEGGALGPGLGYIEWTLQFRNESRDQRREARAKILMPPGGVASRLTLWIGGEEREGAIGGREQVVEAYREVALVRRRDPALLTAVGPEAVLLQCFPIEPLGCMKVKVGITAPLVVREGKAFLRLPYISECNFEIPDRLNHKVWAESPCVLASVSAKLLG